MNRTKVLGSRFQHCLIKFTIFLVETSSERRLFRHWSDYVLRVSEIQKLWGSSFFSKCLKFNLDFRNAVKDSEKLFYFWDNCIWIGIIKLSLWRTRYFSFATNVFTSSPKILHLYNRSFFQLNFLGSDWWIW